MRRLACVAALAVLVAAAPAGASGTTSPKPACAGAASLTVIGPISNTFTSADLQSLASIGRELRRAHLAHVNTSRLAARIAASLGAGYSAQLAAVTALANACVQDHVIAAVPATTTPTTSSLPAVLPSGTYTDGPDGTPHYFLTLTTNPDGSLSGTVTFLAQDGREPVAFTFSGTTQGGVATLTPSTGSTITAPYSAGLITLNGCTAFLQFATSTDDCRFVQSPTGQP